MPKRGATIVAVVVAVVALSVIGAFATGLLDISQVTGVDTATKRFGFYEWAGTGTWAGGELLDAPAYVGGFTGDGHSDKFVASGEAGRTGASCTRLAAFVYKFWFKPASGTYPAEHIVDESPLLADSKFAGNIPSHFGFVLIKEDYQKLSAGQGCPDRLTAPASLMTVTGNFYGQVLVELYAERLDFLYDYWAIVAYDRAPVQPGWGVVNIENSESLIAVGEDLRIHYDVGAACAKSVDPGATNPCGWTLMVRNRDSGATPQGWSDKTLGDFVSGTVSVTVTASWFKIGSHNEYEVKLFNQVNLQDAKIFVTIDDRTLAPGTPTVAISPDPPYSQGQTITVSLSAKPNDITKAVIVDFHVIVRQGDRILLDNRVPASDGKGTATFVIADESIDVQVEATAFDGSRTSGVFRQIMTVKDTDQNNNPPPGTGIPWLQIGLIVVGIVLILVGVFLAVLPWYVRVVLIIVGVALIGIGALSLIGVL